MTSMPVFTPVARGVSVCEGTTSHADSRFKSGGHVRDPPHSAGRESALRHWADEEPVGATRLSGDGVEGPRVHRGGPPAHPRWPGARGGHFSRQAGAIAYRA